MVPQVAQLSKRPKHYVCPSCHLYLLTWDVPTDWLEIFHKVGLWTDFRSGDVRLICQNCLGATDTLPARLVRLLRQRLGLALPHDPRQEEEERQAALRDAGRR
jgi:hypothetical protein